MPTQNRRITFMATDELCEKLNNIRKQQRFSNMSEGGIIRELIIMAIEEDENKAIEEEENGKAADV